MGKTATSEGAACGFQSIPESNFLPLSIELNDIPFFLGKGNSGADFMQAIKDQFEVLYEEGKTNGRVMAIALHPFIISVPYRHKYFEKALEYICHHKEVWLATGSKIANWYYDQYLSS